MVKAIVVISRKQFCQLLTAQIDCCSGSLAVSRSTTGADKRRQIYQKI